MLAQEERDNDAELDLHQMTAHRNLMHEREEKQALKGEQAIMRKKFSTFQAEMGKLKNALEEREADDQGAAPRGGRPREGDRAAQEGRAGARGVDRRQGAADGRAQGEEQGAREVQVRARLQAARARQGDRAARRADHADARDDPRAGRRAAARLQDASVGMEHGFAEKQAKIESLQEECKKTRRQVLEKERGILNFFGRDVQRLVVDDRPARSCARASRTSTDRS